MIRDMNAHYHPKHEIIKDATENKWHMNRLSIPASLVLRRLDLPCFILSRVTRTISGGAVASAMVSMLTVLAIVEGI